MSLNCPRCGHPIEQDFGMITCAGCMAVLFVDMDGQIQVSSESAEDPGISNASNQETSAASDLSHSSSDGFLPDVPSADVESFQIESTAEPEFVSEPEMPVESASNSDFSFEPPNEATSNPAFASEFSSEESQNGLADLSEVSDFGNAHQDFGALSYHVVIENIDTSDIRKKLSEALSDSKFQWDVNEILQKIEKGRLELGPLNPAKASVLVRRLQDVPVRVGWNQKNL